MVIPSNESKTHRETEREKKERQSEREKDIKEEKRTKTEAIDTRHSIAG